MLQVRELGGPKFFQRMSAVSCQAYANMIQLLFLMFYNYCYNRRLNQRRTGNFLLDMETPFLTQASMVNGDAYAELTGDNRNSPRHAV